MIYDFLYHALAHTPLFSTLYQKAWMLKSWTKPDNICLSGITKTFLIVSSGLSIDD